jgi:hypothetical protein
MNLAEKTISSICQSIQYSYMPNKFDYSGSELFIKNEISRLPDFVKFLFIFLVYLFSISSITRYGTFFYRLNIQKKIKIINSWKSSPFSFRRDFIRFFEVLILFNLTSQEIF